MPTCYKKAKVNTEQHFPSTKFNPTRIPQETSARRSNNRRNVLPQTSLCGRRANRESPLGSHRGARGDPAGTSSALRWPAASSVKNWIFTPEGST